MNIQVEGSLECSISNLIKRCKIHIAAEQEKTIPDNSLISVLCDSVRLANEYVEHVQHGNEK